MSQLLFGANSSVEWIQNRKGSGQGDMTIFKNNSAVCEIKVF